MMYKVSWGKGVWGLKAATRTFCSDGGSFGRGLDP